MKTPVFLSGQPQNRSSLGQITHRSPTRRLHDFVPLAPDREGLSSFRGCWEFFGSRFALGRKRRLNVIQVETPIPCRWLDVLGRYSYASRQLIEVDLQPPR